MRLLIYKNTISGHDEAIDTETGLVYTKSISVSGELTVGVNSIVAGRAYGRMPGTTWDDLLKQNEQCAAERAAFVCALEKLGALAERLVADNERSTIPY